MKPVGVALAAFGAVLLLAGLALGFVPLSAQDVGCGSAFRASDEAFVSDLADSFNNVQAWSAAAECNDRRAMFKPIATTFAFVGGAVLLIGVIVTKSAQPARTVDPAP